MDEEERGRTGEPGEADRREREPEGGPEQEIIPWRDVFFRPRATTRWLLAHETASTARMLWLSFTALFIAMLFLTVMFFPDSFRVSRIQLVFLTPLFFLLSWVYFLVQSYLLCVLSRLAGGRCEVWEMQVVNAFTTVIPAVVLGLVRLGGFYLAGREGLAAKLVDNVCVVWAAYITLGGIAAAAGISTLRALAVYMVSFGVWAAAALLVFWLAPGN
jgi:hypothetical protein